MKKFFTLAAVAALALSAGAATPTKHLPAGATLNGSMSANRLTNSVLKTKIKAAAPVTKAEDDEDVVEIPAPTNLKMELNAQGAIDITWDGGAQANYYEVLASAIVPVKGGETFKVADADFSDIESNGTVAAPEYSDYLIETNDQLPGAQFILPCYAPGAIGVEDYYYYAYFGYYAGIETGSYDLSLAKGKKVTVTMEVASGTNADLYCELYTWSEEDGDYVNADSYIKEGISSSFTTLTFDLTGVNEESIFSIYPYGDPDTYEFDGNLFFRSIKITMETEAEGEVEIPVLMAEGEESSATIKKELVAPGNTYCAVVKAYMLDDEYYIEGESDYCDPVYYTVSAGVTDVTVDADTTAPVYYNLQGIRLDNPTGVCIEVKGGKAQKVVK